ncbi:TRM11 family SAM-dependent methyltransferase [Paraherbaspirillum soli]|uniref:Methyltransferase n=1 Tax=Paraherbaspirillum soli TaxID=631222 RepID=A0ABW0M564_9BURK
MDDNSWLALTASDPTFQLPADLAQRDPFAARDIGWVEQMRPFIRQFSLPGQTVLDPFCGMGTTLVAAHLEGRRGLGIEVEPERVDIAQQRLSRLQAQDCTVLQGDALTLMPGLPPAHLILTNVPYFGCRWPEQLTDHKQLYNSATYAEFLEGLRQTLAALKPCLHENGYFIVMAENLRIGQQFIPLASDVGRLLAERYVLVDERILVYERPRHALTPLSFGSNRSHEYAFIARNQPKPIDLAETLACLQALASDLPDFVVYGSFARWLQKLALPRLPADADLLVSDDPQRLTAFVGWFEQHGFQVTRWGAPLHAPLAAAASRHAHYFRAERLLANGSLCLIDLCFEDSRHRYADAVSQAIVINGLRVLCSSD